MERGMGYHSLKASSETETLRSFIAGRQLPVYPMQVTGYPLRTTGYRLHFYVPRRTSSCLACEAGIGNVGVEHARRKRGFVPPFRVVVGLEIQFLIGLCHHTPELYEYWLSEESSPGRRRR